MAGQDGPPHPQGHAWHNGSLVQIQCAITPVVLLVHVSAVRLCFHATPLTLFLDDHKKFKDAESGRATIS